MTETCIQCSNCREITVTKNVDGAVLTVGHTVFDKEMSAPMYKEQLKQLVIALGLIINEEREEETE